MHTGNKCSVTVNASDKEDNPLRDQTAFTANVMTSHETTSSGWEG